MLNTKQVREIMRKHGKGVGFLDPIYTNKPTSVLPQSVVRHVKCYYNEYKDQMLVDELCRRAGYENVKITQGSTWKFQSRAPGLIVKCILA